MKVEWCAIAACSPHDFEYMNSQVQYAAEDSNGDWALLKTVADKNCPNGAFFVFLDGCYLGCYGIDKPAICS